MREDRRGKNCLKYLERWWNKKEGRGTKILKKGGKLSQGVGVFNGGGLEPSYKVWFNGTFSLVSRNYFSHKGLTILQRGYKSKS